MLAVVDSLWEPTSGCDTRVSGSKERIAHTQRTREKGSSLVVEASPLWIPLLLHQSVEPVHPRGGVVYDLPLLFGCDAAKRLLNELLRTREGGGKVRIVRRPHDVVRAVAMKLGDEHWLVDECGIDLALDVLTRLERQLDRRQAAEAILHHVHPPHEISHPGDIVFGRDDLQAWKAFEHSVQNEYGKRTFDLMV